MNKNTEGFYNKFAVFYPLVDIFLRPQKGRLIGEINSMPLGRLLEIGVGNGSHLKLYKTHDIIGIDSSSAMLKAAEKRKRSNMSLLQMDGEALLFKDETFNYIILSHIIAVSHDPEKLLQECYRVLKPRGSIFILNHFTPKNRLRYVDQFFQHFSRIFHFKSVFFIDSISALKKFTLVKEISFGRLSYFKLLIYRKA